MREYDLLVGILACQLRLVSRGALVRFAAALADDPGTSLLDYLLLSKALSETDQQFLCRIADTIVHAHHGDEKAALKAFGGDEAAGEAFSGSIAHTERGWGPSEDQTVLASQLPHGLPAQIAPESFGRYTRGSEYARGGIGRILLVHDEQLGRDVILKELLPEHTVSPTDSTLSRMPQPESPRSPMRQSAAMMARFLQEAKITGQLEHPSIVPVYELGTRKDGQLYYTMKLVRGETLAESIKACKSPEDRLGLLRSFLDVCQAMAYAHSKGVIHRDLKPSNIMVGEFGECVVLDWGLAKMQKDVDAHREALEKTISQLKLGEEQQAAFKTKSKDVLGTPLYMAPEQARGEAESVGVQSDVYSLGVILYEILSGSLPHPWSNSMDTIHRVGSLPAPQISQAAPQTPPELAAICDKALAFHAKNRYNTAQELASDVQRFLEGAVVDAYAYKVTDILGRLYRRHKSQILALGIASLFVTCVITISYIKVYNSREAERSSRKVAESKQEEAERARKLADTARGDANAARHEAETALKRALRQQYLSQIRLAESYIKEQHMRLANEALDKSPPSERDWVWRYLYNEANASIFRIRSEKSAIFQAIYDPTGRFIAATRAPEAPGLWNATTGEFIRDFEGGPQRYNYATFNHDGSLFAAIGEKGVLDIWDVETGAAVQRLVHDSDGLSIAFSPDMLHVWAGYKGGDVVEWNIDNGTESRKFSTNGEIAMALYSQTEGHVFLAFQSKPREDGPESSKERIVARDSGSGKIVYSIPGSNLWMSPDGTTFVRSKTSELVESPPIQNDRQERFAFCSKLSLHDTRTGRQLAEFNGHPANILDASFSADGKMFVSSADDGSVLLWSIDQKKPIHELHVPIAFVRVYITDDDSKVSGCTYENRLQVWDLNSGSLVSECAGENKFVSGSEMSPDRQNILTSSGFHTFEVFDSNRPRGYAAVERESFNSTKKGIFLSDIVISGNESKAALVLDNKSIEIVDLQLFQSVAKFQLAENVLPRASLTEDGRSLMYCGGTSTICIGNVAMHSTKTFATIPAPLTALRISPSGKIAVFACENKTIQVWKVEEQEKCLDFYIDHAARAIALSADETQIVVGCDDGHIRVYETKSGILLKDILSCTSSIVAVAAQAINGIVASVGSDGTVSAIDLLSGQAQFHIGADAPFSSTMDSRFSLRFSRDGLYLLVHHDIYRTIVVDARDGEVLLNVDGGIHIQPIGDNNTILRVFSAASLSFSQSNQ